MNKLFWKIFLSFWLAMLLIVGLGSWINLMMLRTAGLENFPEGVQQRLQQVAERTAEAIQQGKRRPMRQRRRGLQLRIIDDNGQILRGPPLPVELAHLVRVSKRTEGGGFVAIPVLNESGQMVRVIASTRLPPGVLFGGPRSALARLLVAAAISALMCWALARYLVAPIQRLRQASRLLADGRLDARTATNQRYAGDEIGQLSRDFDQMAERLQQARNTQQQLLRDMSHELRSPLARLQVALGLAKKSASAKSANVAPELDRIENEANRLEELIAEILILSRELEESQPSELTLINLAELIQLIVDDANYEAGQSEQQVLFNPPEQPPMIEVDTHLLSRAIENVIRNGLLHSPAGTMVQVRLNQDLQQATVTVSDSGPGVPEEQLKQIFEPFHQVDTARSNGSRGHGLGLAIAKAAVGRHGGTITAQNGNAGGLQVVINIPRAQSPGTE